MGLRLSAVAEPSTLKQEKVQSESTLVIMLAPERDPGMYNSLCLYYLPYYEHLSSQANIAEIRGLAVRKNTTPFARHRYS